MTSLGADKIGFVDVIGIADGVGGVDVIVVMKGAVPKHCIF